MKNFTNPLNNLKIASPCSQDWNAMIGDDRKRFCGDCKLNVYNLSGMTKNEAEQFLANSEGRVCVRFYRRADGSVLTQDCPVGWAAVKRRVSKMATACASLFFGVITSLGFVSLFNQSKSTTIGELGSYPTASPTPKKYPTMGNIAVPTPTPTQNENVVTMGAIAPMTKKSPTPKKSDSRETDEKSETLLGKLSVSRN